MLLLQCGAPRALLAGSLGGAELGCMAGVPQCLHKAPCWGEPPLHSP